MTPVYGLAECSVALAFPPIGRGPRVDRVAREPFQREGLARPAAPGDLGALEFVSAGRALPEHEIRIVDDAGSDVGERVVGRLVFRGPSMTSGYYRKPEATAAITLPGGWLDSGDLAYRADGEIHVCGRRKDLIIKAGRNLVPQEIEEAAAGVPGVRRGCVVAFGVRERDARHRGARGRGGDARQRPARARADRERRDRARRRGRGGASGRGRAGGAGRRAQDVERQAATRGHEGRVRQRGARRGAADDARPESAARARRPRSSSRAPGRDARARLLYAAWLALALPPLLLPAWALVVLVPSRRFGFALARFTVRTGLRLMGIRLEVSGLERLPRQGPLVLACNHASYADVVALVALLPIDVLFVAKREVLGYPLVASFVRRCGHLTVDRWDAVQSVADADVVARALAAGSDVLFFPEGTFVAATGLRPFRLGAFMAAARAGAPLVPLALRGTRHVLRGDWGLPRPGRLSLWVGDPIRPRGTDMAALVALRAEAMDRIAEHCGEPRLDLVAAGPARPASA